MAGAAARGAPRLNWGPGAGATGGPRLSEAAGRGGGGGLGATPLTPQEAGVPGPGGRDHPQGPRAGAGL